MALAGEKKETDKAGAATWSQMRDGTPEGPGRGGRLRSGGETQRDTRSSYVFGSLLGGPRRRAPASPGPASII